LPLYDSQRNNQATSNSVEADMPHRFVAAYVTLLTLLLWPIVVDAQQRRPAAQRPATPGSSTPAANAPATNRSPAHSPSAGAPTASPSVNSPGQSTPPAQQPASSAHPDVDAIRQGAVEFVQAFDRGDAAAVADCWTDKGEYQDETGQTFTGRAAIQQEYARLFGEHPGAKLQLHIDAVRLLGDAIALEQGHASVELPSGQRSAGSQYSALHVKQGDKWLMARVQDEPASGSVDRRALDDLRWLEGNWSAEEYGAKMNVTFRWIADKQFLERTFTVQRPNGETHSGLQIIGWNPSLGRIQSWIFTSDGGMAEGLWSPIDGGWAVETSGTSADGMPTNSINWIGRLDHNGIVSRSTHRSVGSSALPDTDEVVLKRIPSQN
jgi:uncharacterized protein (TIGR02246 family)